MTTKKSGQQTELTMQRSGTVAMTKVQRILLQDRAKQLVGTMSDDALWDAYRNAKLMDDPEEVYLLRQVIDLQKAH